MNPNLLGVDQPDRGAGQVFNAGDEEVLTVRQVVELVAGALGADLELVSMPADLAVPARPLLTQPSSTHRVPRRPPGGSLRPRARLRAGVQRSRWAAPQPPDVRVTQAGRVSGSATSGIRRSVLPW